MLPARATRGLELALFFALVSPLLAEWFETTSASSRLSYALLVPALALVLALRERRAGPEFAPAAPQSLSKNPPPAESQPDTARLGATTRRIGAGILRGVATMPRRAWLSSRAARDSCSGSQSRAAGAEALAALFAWLGAAAFVGGTLSGIFTLTLCGVPLATLAYVARLGGRTALVRCAPALGLLLLMVPPPMPLLDRVNPLLIRASGQTALKLLTLFDPEVTWSSPMLVFQGWRLIVAEACSGSGTFLMLFALSAFLAALFRLGPWRALTLILCSFPLTLLVNGVRIASSALVIARFGAAAGEGLAHELLGQVVVLLGAALLALSVARWAPRARLEVVA